MRAEGLPMSAMCKATPSVDQSVWIARGETDFGVNYVPIHVASIDAGVPIKVLAGLHSGCLELIANDSVHNIPDLRGKRVGMDILDLGVACVGHSDCRLCRARSRQRYPVGHPARTMRRWRTALSKENSTHSSAAARCARATRQKIGHTILNTTTDPPWSQHFCCMISATADYVNKYPVATKRVLRAIFKATDLCASDPPLVARQLVDRGFVTSYE